MVMSKRNLFVRWAYLGEKVPHSSDLCTIFWQCVGKGLIVALLGLLVALCVVFWEAVLFVLGTMLAAIAGVVLLCCTIWFFSDGPGDDVLQWVKGNYCPRVNIE